MEAFLVFEVGEIAFTDVEGDLPLKQRRALGETGLLASVTLHSGSTAVAKDDAVRDAFRVKNDQRLNTHIRCFIHTIAQTYRELH